MIREILNRGLHLGRQDFLRQTVNDDVLRTKSKMDSMKSTACRGVRSIPNKILNTYYK